MTVGATQKVERVTHVVQGEYAISADPDLVLTTILGSCVSACLRDPAVGVGGMNHFLLPGDTGEKAETVKYGVHAMELLINSLLQRGAMRSRLEAKLFGGACVVRGLSTDVGAKNAAFAKRFLEAEGIACVSEDLGGAQARRIRYWPVSGRASLQWLAPSAAQLHELERRAPEKPATAGAVELF
ncbi:MAG TPA: chemotaxis protein CheD [Caulobacterales bacterium]|nr:chemotaxis protein CheD [Caulobacterales bacterium]